MELQFESFYNLRESQLQKLILKYKRIKNKINKNIMKEAKEKKNLKIQVNKNRNNNSNNILNSKYLNELKENFNINPFKKEENIKNKRKTFTEKIQNNYLRFSQSKAFTPKIY